MDYASLTDLELAIRVKRGDARAFAEIYSRHWKKLLHISREKLPAHENAEDVVQDIFVKLWEQRDRIDISNLGGYLFTSLRNAIINRYRVRLLHEKYSLQTQDALATQENADDGVQLNELTCAFEKHLNNLPEKTVKIFKLSRIEFKSAKEIAATLNIPQRTVEHHIHSAVKRLRHLLQDFFVYLAIFSF